VINSVRNEKKPQLAVFEREMMRDFGDERAGFEASWIRSSAPNHFVTTGAKIRPVK